MSPKVNFEDLVFFLQKQTGANKTITKDTLIEDDLGVTGDDAEDLIIMFSKRYNVKIDNFAFSKYFYGEPNPFVSQNHKIKPLTVGHLEKALIAGRLDEEVINS